MPGSAERQARFFALLHEHSEQWREAAKTNAPLAPFPVDHGDYDPSAGIGDPNCTCASACFYIWAAGAERDGDIVQIHRPYFNSGEYSALTASEAQAAYGELQAKVRDFLAKVGVSTALIDKMMSVDFLNTLFR